MKHKYEKAIAIAASLALVLGGVSLSVAYANNSDDKKAESEKTESIIVEKPQADLTKDETVYVLANADGSVQKIIVSDWIKNAIGSDSIKDSSELTDVENVKGDETYTMDGDTMRVWDAKGNDIYYQGNIEKELPVGLTVSYELDGTSISPSELAGKSGKLTIRYEYKNNQYEMVEIDGKQEKMYVPFAMLTGVLLDGDVCRNVEVSNGKLINDGDRIAIVGMAFPGLQSNLNLDSDKVEIPDYVEITADVTNFEMTNTVTVAVNDIFSRLNTDKLDSFDELSDSLGEMTDAMEQLMDGSSQLYDGLCTLLDKSGDLIAGIDRLAEGAAKLKDGANALKNGASDLADGAGTLSDGTASLAAGADELADGAKALASGLDTLAANNDTLNGGAKQVFESLLSMANTQLAAAGLDVPTLTIENYAKVLDGVIASLDKDKVAAKAHEVALQTVTAKVNEQKDVIKAAVTEAVKAEVTAKVTATVRDNVETQVLAALGMTKETYEAGVAAGVISEEQQAQIGAAIDAQMASEAVLAIVNENVDAQMKTEDVRNIVSVKTEEQVALLIEQNMNSPEVQAQITAALEAAESGAASISGLKGQLDGYRVFYDGLNQYTAGVKTAQSGASQLSAGADKLDDGAAQVHAGSTQLKDGSDKLKAGTEELYAGTNELYDGILTLKDGSAKLVDGVTQLRDGSMKLSDGLAEFNEKGVQKLVDAVDGDLASLTTRLRATVDVSRNYKSFSGCSDEMDGQVKFIYRTDAVDAE